jgi:hypothetical protein
MMEGREGFSRIEFVRIVDSGLDFYFIHPQALGKRLTQG